VFYCNGLLARHISLFLWWNSATCTQVAWCQHRYTYHGSKNIFIWCHLQSYT